MSTRFRDSKTSYHDALPATLFLLSSKGSRGLALLSRKDVAIATSATIAAVASSRLGISRSTGSGLTIASSRLGISRPTSSGLFILRSVDGAGICRGVAIVGNDASGSGSLGVSFDTSASLGAQTLQHGADISGIPDVLVETHEVGGQTGNVRRRYITSSQRGDFPTLLREHTHAGATERLGVRVRTNADGENVDTRSEDVDIRTKVGEGGLCVVLGVDGPDGDGTGSRCR